MTMEDNKDHQQILCESFGPINVTTPKQIFKILQNANRVSANCILDLGVYGV